MKQEKTRVKKSFDALKKAHEKKMEEIHRKYPTVKQHKKG